MGVVPGLGQHTETVLAELGMGADELAPLRAAGRSGRRTSDVRKLGLVQKNPDRSKTCVKR